MLRNTSQKSMIGRILVTAFILLVMPVNMFLWCERFSFVAIAMLQERRRETERMKQVLLLTSSPEYSLSFPSGK